MALTVLKVQFFSKNHFINILGALLGCTSETYLQETLWCRLQTKVHHLPGYEATTWRQVTFNLEFLILNLWTLDSPNDSTVEPHNEFKDFLEYLEFNDANG